jgi:signal transduction histidine kinase
MSRALRTPGSAGLPGPAAVHVPDFAEASPIDSPPDAWPTEPVLTLETLRRAHDDLKAELDDLRAELDARTRQLEEMEQTLRRKQAESARAGGRMDAYQRQLRALAAQLSLSEARQRRIIAGELHDHVGQALAFIRLRLVRLQGDAVFSGFEDSVADILRLVEQTINSMRSLTFQISPPVLYELGLGAALEWLAERLGGEHGVDIVVEADGALDGLPVDTSVLLFQAVRELIVNAIKHADPRKVEVRADLRKGEAVVVVTDDGRGFDPATVSAGEAGTFGLFSIRERLDYLGGAMELVSAPGAGASVTLRTPAASGSGGPSS